MEKNEKVITEFVEKETTSNEPNYRGIKAMPFIVGNEAFEKLGTIGTSSNFLVYLTSVFHMNTITATNLNNIFQGTCNFGTILGAFLSDTYFGRYKTLGFASISSFTGMLLLTMTAAVSKLHPPSCGKEEITTCQGPTTGQMAFLLSSFALLVIGGSGIRPCNLAFGADQFNPNTESGRKGITSFFNWYYFTYTFAVMVSLTIIVYVQSSISWAIGLGIPTLLMFFSCVFFFVGTRIYVIVLPQGSPLLGVVQVMVAAIKKRRLRAPEQPWISLFDYISKNSINSKLSYTDQFRFLDKAAIRSLEDEVNTDGSAANPWRLSTVQQVEEVKCLFRLIPIWFSILIYHVAFVQQNNYLVFQALQSDRRLIKGSTFKIPAATYIVITMLTLTIWIPLYDRIILPFLQKLTGKEGGITVLQRMGIGIVLSGLSLTVSALIVQWMANVVLVQKQNGKWRVCIDYTDLNKACPKDFYPLPHIDQLIDATSGYALLSFMDAFSGYHQISMCKEDIPKTAFITHRSVYAYKKMTFGLINAGATYQRMMNHVFRYQLGKNMEVYVDDMIVKSMLVHKHLDDLEECFQTIRHHNLRLNPTKCTFGLGAGKFLGYLVSRRGIEANPKKIQAILNMRTPQSFKDVQRLTGRIAALRRFMSKSTERCLPFFDTLKGPKNAKTFQWTSECEDAFQSIKTYLSSAPLLVKPAPAEPLYLCLAASSLAVGAVLVREVGGKQHPVYYVSRVLRDAETRYPNIEKFAFALMTASRKLRQYFQGRLVIVYTDQPLKKVMSRPEVSGRLAAWMMELSQFFIEYHPRTAIKGQALADFVVECSFSEADEVAVEAEESDRAVAVLQQKQSSWTLYADGSSTTDVSGAGIILTSPEGFKVQQAIRFDFRATNNEAEYEAVLAGYITISQEPRSTENSHLQ